MFHELIPIFTKRRENLIQLLEMKEAYIAAEEQHQIYGAIKELENLLDTLYYYRKECIRGGK